MEAFCPKCGTETEGLGPRGLCENCYTEEHELVAVPDALDVAVCPSCGRAKIGPQWVEVEGEQDLLYEVLSHAIDGEHVVAVSYTENEDPTKEHTYDVTMVVERRVEGVAVQQEVDTRLTVEQEQCEVCGKFHGGYYTYKLQIRGEVTEDAVNAVMDRAAAMTNENREHFISDVEESEHGVDVFVSTRRMAEELLKVLEQDYAVEKKRSRELVGQNSEGQEVYRTVIAAHIQDEEA